MENDDDVRDKGPLKFALARHLALLDPREMGEKSGQVPVTLFCDSLMKLTEFQTMMLIR